MISVSPKHRVFLAIKPIDFRRGINGISALCQYTYQQDPFSGHYFVFTNKRKTAIKILFYDAQGYCLYQKKLSSGKYQHWPRSPTDLVSLTPAQLHVLLDNGNPKTVETEPPWRPLPLT